MKYQCKDCGAIYDEKIDYCDCGNNTFDEIDDSPLKPIKTPKTNLPKGEIISRIFFAFCLILSGIILFLIPIKKISAPANTPATQTTIPKDIPDIEKIWKSPLKPEPKPVEQEPEPVVIIQKIIRKIEEPAVVKPVTHTPVTKPVNKPIAQPKPVQQKPIQEKPAAQTQPKVTQPSQPEKPKVTQNSQAVIRYKNALREVLLSKLAVNTIPGEGTCIIKFRVDETGKLIERGFVQYADNKTMNDAIYYMLMSVPKYQAPPAEYNGEVIRLQFHINNGEYEISFK